MAFTRARSGDRLGVQFVPSSVPKAFGSNYIAAWAAALATPQTVPQVGDLVKPDTTALLNDGVRQCVANEVPYGIVISLNSSNQTLSVIKFSKATSLIFEYTGAAPVLGNSIQADASAGTIAISGVLRQRVHVGGAPFANPPTGIGLVVAIDSPRTGLLVVEFGIGNLY